jgi:hypothetical protein
MKRCPKCGETKPLTEFYERKKYRWESERYQSYCKECVLKRTKDWYDNKGGREVCLSREKLNREKNPAIFKERHKSYIWRIKIEALNAYGGKCKCCGEKEPKFLAIDHIDGGGNEHRKTIKGTIIYLWLKQHSYPKGFQVLCHNCNMAKAFWGVCPHKQ